MDNITFPLIRLYSQLHMSLGRKRKRQEDLFRKTHKDTLVTHQVCLIVSHRYSPIVGPIECPWEFRICYLFRNDAMCYSRGEEKRAWIKSCFPQTKSLLHIDLTPSPGTHNDTTGEVCLFPNILLRLQMATASTAMASFWTLHFWDFRIVFD